MKRISDSERIILEWIWDQGESTSSKCILEHFLGTTSWKQTTISTFLRRLIDKGYLTAKRVGRSFKYMPVITREEFVKNSVVDIIEKECDNSLVKFIEYYFDATDDKLGLAELKKRLDTMI